MNIFVDNIESLNRNMRGNVLDSARAFGVELDCSERRLTIKYHSSSKLVRPSANAMIVNIVFHGIKDLRIHDHVFDAQLTDVEIQKYDSGTGSEREFNTPSISFKYSGARVEKIQPAH